MDQKRIDAAEYYYKRKQESPNLSIRDVANELGVERDWLKKCKYSYDKKSEKDTREFHEFSRERESYSEDDRFINIICSSERILSKEEVISKFNIDSNIWEVDFFRIKTHEGYRKDRKVKWHVRNGNVKEGMVSDSGKMLVVPMYGVEVRFKKKSEINKDDVKEYIKELSSYEPKINIIPKQSNSGLLAICPIADLHYGMFATKEETGNEYNTAIAQELYYSAVGQMAKMCEEKEIEEILFITGNDFINSDNQKNTTPRGTVQDTSPFLKQLSREALKMIIDGTATFLSIAPVSIVNVLSNHDEMTMYLLTLTVEEKFESDHVIIYNNERPTTYIPYGKNLLGFSHDMKKDVRLGNFTTDAKQYWSEINHAYLFLAHLHKAMMHEPDGMLDTYRFPTVSGQSRWSANEMQFPKLERRTQMFIIDKEKGLESTINIIP